MPLSTYVYFENNLPTPVSCAASVSPGLSSEYWGAWATTAAPTSVTPAYWMSRCVGIHDGDTWYFTTQFTLGGVAVSFQVQVTGTWSDSDIWIQVQAGQNASGWSTENNVSIGFTGTDGAYYEINGALLSEGAAQDNVLFWVSTRVMTQIANVVVLMMENRSLDNLLGGLYQTTNPANVFPAGSAAQFNGLATGNYANSDPRLDNGIPMPVVLGTTENIDPNGVLIPATTIPNPDPGEGFSDVAQQISGTMGGFLANYADQVISTYSLPVSSPQLPGMASQIIECYSPAQVPVLSTLATSYAVSDAWFASVPSQTWPNRRFLLSGSCGGQVNNTDLAMSGLNTVFDILSSQNLSWQVYSDNAVSLVKTIYGQYWDNEGNFEDYPNFPVACQNGTLPALCLVEPPFGTENFTDASYHPPYDVGPGEAFLYSVVETIQNSPYRDQILLIVLFDEHGGTYDHVEPLLGAQPPWPEPVATDGTGYTFNQFGVRVPAIIVSPYVTAGTVFRSPTGVPYDHTSVLATVRDWLGLQGAFAQMLPSPRILAAPTLQPLFNSTPAIPPANLPQPSNASAPLPPDSTPLNANQRAIRAAAFARAQGKRFTPEQWARVSARLATLGDLRRHPVPAQPAAPKPPKPA